MPPVNLENLSNISEGRNRPDRGGSDAVGQKGKKRNPSTAKGGLPPFRQGRLYGFLAPIGREQSPRPGRGSL